MTEARADFSQRLADLAAKLRREMATSLNQSVRRLRVFESEAQWSCALVEAAAPFCTRALVFTVRANTLRLPGVDLTPIPVETVPAFAAVIESKDSIVAMRTDGELSAGLASYLTDVADGRCWLFPILSGNRVAAVLYADGEVDSNSLELISNVAGVMLPGPEMTSQERTSDKPSEEKIAGLVTIQPAPARPGHLEAQRVARTQVAEIVLYHSQALQSGRRNRDLYQSLGLEIDARRQIFRRRFIENSTGMADYLHVELLRTLAKDDAQLLGADYPGPLV